MASSPRTDLPGYRSTQETERLGLLTVEAHLLRHGFKVTKVEGSFDDGLDLLVAQHDGLNVLPAFAGLQVRSGPSHRGLSVDRHERYWREHNLPVFRVVLSEPAPEHPAGGWCDAKAYLRDHPDARTIPVPQPFPGELAPALHAACEQTRGALSALDVFDDDWKRQATAVVALAALAHDRRVTTMLRSRVGRLGPRATHYALAVLLMAEQAGADTGTQAVEVAAAVLTLFEEEAEGHVDLDAWHDGAALAYRLLKARRSSSAAVLEAALVAPFAESTVLLLAMAISLAEDRGTEVLDAALRARPALAQSPDVAGLADALAENGRIDFSL